MVTILQKCCNEEIKIKIRQVRQLDGIISFYRYKYFKKKMRQSSLLTSCIFYRFGRLLRISFYLHILHNMYYIYSTKIFFKKNSKVEIVKLYICTTVKTIKLTERHFYALRLKKCCQLFCLFLFNVSNFLCCFVYSFIEWWTDKKEIR